MFFINLLFSIHYIWLRVKDAEKINKLIIEEKILVYIEKNLRINSFYLVVE